MLPKSYGQNTLRVLSLVGCWRGRKLRAGDSGEDRKTEDILSSIGPRKACAVYQNMRTFSQGELFRHLRSSTTKKAVKNSLRRI